jgi:hypothetical protein
MLDTLAVALISAKDTKPLLLTELDSLIFNGVEKQLIVNDNLSDNPVFFILSIVKERVNVFLQKTVGSIIEFKVT